jgi:cystathionine beta-lyase
MTVRKETAIIQSGRRPVRAYGLVNAPLARGSTVLFPTMGEKLATGKRWMEPVETYGLCGNDTHFALEATIALIEGGTRTQVTGSGLSAITVPLLSYMRAGDDLLVPDSVYGPTRSFCSGLLSRYGVQTRYYDPMADEATMTALMQPNTRVLFTESPGSHTFEVQDIPMLARVAHAHGAKLFMDNTWGLHYFQPFTHGVDVSIQALTKYAGGHSDIILGAVTVNTPQDWAWLRTGSLELGNYASPDDCWLCLRGLRTLTIRLEAQAAHAMRVVAWLQAQPEVARVLHPALPDCPGHAFFKRDFTGACSLFGVVFQPRYTAQAVVAMIDAMTHFGIGASWGGYESLILPTTGTIRRTAGSGVFEGEMARIAIGLEAPEDLIADLQAGFAALNAHGEN